MAESTGSKTDTLIKLVLVFCISLLSFTVGTFVGKQFSDRQHKFAALESEYPAADRSMASIPDEVTEVKPASVISEADIDRLVSEELDMDDEDSRSPQSDTDASMKMADAAKMEESPKMEKMEEVAEKVAAGKMVKKEVKVEPAEKRVPNALPTNVASTTIGKFTVQVAAFGTEAEAIKHASDLKSKGYSAFYVPAVVKGKTYYRVSVGIFSERGEAMKYQKKFMAEAGVRSALVQKIRK